MELQLNYESTTGEVIKIDAGFDYVTGCNCDQSHEDDHSHVTRVNIYRTVNEFGENVILDPMEEAAAALQLSERTQEMLDATDCGVDV